MHARTTARLATLLASLAATAHAPADLPGPVDAHYRAPIVLHEGGRRVVTITQINDAGLVTLDGASSRTILWSDIHPKSAFDAARRAIDTDEADDWIWLGVKMLQLDQIPLADRAFRVAQRADETVVPVIEKARRLHDEGSDPGEAIENESHPRDNEKRTHKEINEEPPEQPDARGRHLWPVLTEEQLARAIEATRSWAEEKLRIAGVRLRAYESPHYIVYTAGGENTAGRLLQSLESMHQSLKRIFLIPEQTVMYHGKCAVFILDSQPAFVDFERRVFDNDAEGFGGFYHGSTTHVCVVTYTMPSPSRMENLLVHETTHAFMHRYKSRYRLPTWANEGLADFMAATLVTEYDEGRRHWTKAREFVLNGGDPGDIMAQSYRDGSWPNDYSYPVSHMIVRFMIKHKATEFRAWIEDIKDGRNWVEAMAERFSPSPDRQISPDVLAKGFAEQIKSERTYTPD